MMQPEILIDCGNTLMIASTQIVLKTILVESQRRLCLFALRDIAYDEICFYGGEKSYVTHLIHDCIEQFLTNCKQFFFLEALKVFRIATSPQNLWNLQPVKFGIQT